MLEINTDTLARVNSSRHRKRRQEESSTDNHRLKKVHWTSTWQKKNGRERGKKNNTGNRRNTRHEERERIKFRGCQTKSLHFFCSSNERHLRILIETRTQSKFIHHFSLKSTGARSQLSSFLISVDTSAWTSRVPCWRWAVFSFRSLFHVVSLSLFSLFFSMGCVWW